MEQIELEKIKEINRHISEALCNWSDVVLHADADNWAYYLEYSDEDMLNALFLFNHVWQNRAIKQGVLSPSNAIERMDEFRNAIKRVFEIDTCELTDKVIKQANEKHGTESKKNSDEV